MDEGDSSGSTSSNPSPPRFGARPHRFLSARISRALTHPLWLLHRSGPSFFVLGSTSNVYTVTLLPSSSSSSSSCTCPDRAPLSLCKHALYVLLRVLRLPLHRLRLPLPSSLLLAPTAPGVLAPPRTRERFHQLFSKRTGKWVGATCPVCLEGMMMMGDGGGRVVECGACGNGVHEVCLGRWRRARGRRGLTCVMCRARWRAKKAEEEEGGGGYVNLAGYDDGGGRGGGEEEMVVCGGE